MTDALSPHRPRVEGDREQEILAATVAALTEVGYDRLTMDAVAAAAKASKATLYRRWSNKAVLVCSALSWPDSGPMPKLVDTGSLRTDLIESFCDDNGPTADIPLSVLAGLLTALHHDADLQREFYSHFPSRRQLSAAGGLYERAVARRELRSDVDLEVLAVVLPAVCIYRSVVLGLRVDRDFVTRVVDTVIMPRVLRPRGLEADGG